MDKAQILVKARRLIEEEGGSFAMATVSPEGKPHVRYMGAAVFEEPFTLYLETFRKSRKVADVQANAGVELLFGRKDFSEVLNVSGIAEVENSPIRRKMVYDRIPASGNYFKGPDDPELVVLKMTVRRLEFWSQDGQRSPDVVEL
jgi:general stress protein 26